MMNRIRTWIGNMSIRKKIIFYTYTIIVPILFLICIGLWIHDYHSLQKERQLRYQADVRTLADNVEIVLSDIHNISNYIIINQDILAILQADDAEALNRDARLWQHRSPIQMVEDMMALKGGIKTVAIYPENGVMPYLRCIDAVSSYIPTVEKIRDTSLYQCSFEKKGRSTWRYIDKGSSEVYTANRTEKIVLCREIYDLSKKKPLAYLVVGMTDDELEKICRNALGTQQEGVRILDGDGEIFYSLGNFPETGNYDYFSCREQKFGMTVCKAVPSIDAKKMLLEVAVTPLFLLGGVLLGMFPVLWLVSNIISTPLSRVSQAMLLFREGDFSQSVEVRTHDEVGKVAECFNIMVKDIKELIDKNYVYALKEKESELATLQAQINPHFLYNTLDSLYWQASNADQEEIAENIYALSCLFRMVLGQGTGIVTVAQEAELVYRYLEIQRMRFNKRVEFSVEVEPALQEKKIPKLILQPFVENAVVHGAENGDDTCRITVTGKMAEKQMEFLIRDTGVGMTKEQVEAIWSRREEKGSSYKIGRYAIYNVKERLELKYGQAFELKIESEKGKGTTVILRIPYEMDEEET